LWRLGREIRVSTRATGGGQRIDVCTPLATIDGIDLRLAGAHQATNAALAIAAAQAFAAAQGGTVSEDSVRTALADVRISGRMECVQREPRVILDSAHNPLEARRLAEALRRQPPPRTVLVCGILADKDQASMVRELAPLAHRAIVTQPPLAERAGDPARMLAMFRARLGTGRVEFEGDPASAVERAIASAGRGDTVLVTGSMFLVGAVRERWVPERQILDRRTARL
jgi:dihydrofolate synthase/folylpolyglutamate synthase